MQLKASISPILRGVNGDFVSSERDRSRDNRIAKVTLRVICDYASCGFFLCQRGTLGLPRVGRSDDKFQPTAWDGQLETRGNRVDHVTAQSARRRRGVIISFRRYDRREDGSRRRPDDNNRLRGCLHAGNSEHVRARAQVSVRRVCVDR